MTVVEDRQASLDEGMEFNVEEEGARLLVPNELLLDPSQMPWAVGEPSSRFMMTSRSYGEIVLYSHERMVQSMRFQEASSGRASSESSWSTRA